MAGDLIESSESPRTLFVYMHIQSNSSDKPSVTNQNGHLTCLIVLKWVYHWAGQLITCDSHAHLIS